MIKPYINMANRNILLLTLTFLLLSYSLHAATLKGTIYNSQLNPETDVLLEITTQPLQKYLAKDGTYQFTLQPGNYTLTAQKNDIEITEHITITQDGTYVIDLFLLPSSEEDQDLWNDLEEPSVIEPLDEIASPQLWQYILSGIIILALLIRILYMRKKYGSLSFFRKRIRAEAKKTETQHKIELEKKNLVEKVKKGRGNVIILKKQL